MNTTQESVAQTQFLTFFLGEEEYAIGILQVREIMPFGDLTKVPKTPPAIRGVINIRGSVVPVVDLAVKFGLPRSPITKRSCIVIVEVDLQGEQTVMGVLTDSVNQVVELHPDQIEVAPNFGTPIRVDYLKGLVAIGKKFLLILDIGRILSIQELLTAGAIHQTAARAEKASGADSPMDPREASPCNHSPGPDE